MHYGFLIFKINFIDMNQRWDTMPENKTLHSRNEEIVTQFFDFVELHLQNLLKCNDAKSPYIRNQKKLGGKELNIT